MALTHEGKNDVLVVKPGDELWRKCEKTEYQVFADCEYIPPHPEKRIVAYDGYEPVEFLAAIVGGELAGTMRLVYAPNDPEMKERLFPTVDAAYKLRIYPEKLEYVMRMDPRGCIDIAAMAVRKAYRNALTSNALITTLFKKMWSSGIIKFAFAAIDTRFFRKLQKLGVPFEDLGPSTMYWGSYTTAGILDFDQIPRDYVRHK